MGLLMGIKRLLMLSSSQSPKACLVSPGLASRMPSSLPPPAPAPPGWAIRLPQALPIITCDGLSPKDPCHNRGANGRAINQSLKPGPARRAAASGTRREASLSPFHDTSTEPVHTRSSSSGFRAPPMPQLEVHLCLLPT